MSAVVIAITKATSEVSRVSAFADDFTVVNRLTPGVAADPNVALDKVLTPIVKYLNSDQKNGSGTSIDRWCDGR